MGVVQFSDHIICHTPLSNLIPDWMKYTVYFNNNNNDFY
jgi:hypothetical protein